VHTELVCWVTYKPVGIMDAINSEITNNNNEVAEGDNEDNEKDNTAADDNESESMSASASESGGGSESGSWNGSDDGNKDDVEEHRDDDGDATDTMPETDENEPNIDDDVMEDIEDIEDIKDIEDIYQDGTEDDPTVTDSMIRLHQKETSADGQMSILAAQNVMEDICKKNKSYPKKAELYKGGVTRMGRDPDTAPAGEILRSNFKVYERQSILSK
jgi:hypothetical protein